MLCVSFHSDCLLQCFNCVEVKGMLFPQALYYGESFGFFLTTPTNLKYQNPLQSRISGCLNAFDPLCKSVWTDISLPCSLFSTLISNLSSNLFYVPVLPW